MQKLVMAIMGALLSMMIFVACSSDEPVSDPNDDIRTDSVVDDSTYIDSTELTNEHKTWRDTVKPVYVDEYVPYSGVIEPLTAEHRPVFTKGKKWLVWSKCYMSRTSLNEIICYDESSSNENGDKWVHADSGMWKDVPLYFKEEGSRVYYAKRDKVINGKYTYTYSLCYDSYLHKLDYDDYYFEKNGKYPDPDFSFILSRGVITLCGKTRRATKVIYTGIEGCPVDYWVEGIGPLLRVPTNLTISEYFNAYTIYWHTLLECWDGDNKIYDAREFSDDLYTPIDIF